MSHHRARGHLSDIKKRYPRAWKQCSEVREGKGIDLPNWPDWCFMPIAATLAIVQAEQGLGNSPVQWAMKNPQYLYDPAILAALGSWRVTQGIYRFDPTIYEELISTPLQGDLPCDVIYYLPEWSVYIETPHGEWLGKNLHGFWVHLEYDINKKRDELRLLLDMDNNLVPVPLHIGPWPLKEAVQKAFSESKRQQLVHGMSKGANFDTMDREAISVQSENLSPLISLVLYLCSQPDEIGVPGHRPEKPKPKKTKKGIRWFSPDRPTEWEVGVRIGAALRQAYSVDRNSDGVEYSEARVRPHIRRAHWHGYWKGPKNPERTDERRFMLKWLPPIPINVENPDKLPAVVRTVS